MAGTRRHWTALAAAAVMIAGALGFAAWLRQPPRGPERQTYIVAVGLTLDGEVDYQRRELTAAEHQATLATHAAQLAAWRKLAEEARASKPADLATRTPSDWPQFRGPQRDGVAAGAALAGDWQSRPPRELWRRPVGQGWASFAVVGDFAVTHEQRGMEHEAVVCSAWRTGETCWETRYPARFAEDWTEAGPRATPSIVDGDVFALGGAGDLLRLAGRDGSVRWRRNILADAGAGNALFGVCGSPLVADGQVVVCPGGPQASVVAYDAATGARRWAAGSAKAAYAPPTLATLAGVQQVLDFNAEGLASYEWKTGTPLWRLPWITNPPEMNNVCPPIIPPALQTAECGVVFVASGYGVGCALLEVRPPFSNANKPWAWQVRERWRTKSLKPKFAAAVLRGDFVYGLDDGILACVDLRDGSRRWKGGRFAHGQLALAGDKLLALCENGDLALAAAEPDAFRLLGRVPCLRSRSWGHPTLVGKHALVRNNREAVLLGLP